MFCGCCTPILSSHRCCQEGFWYLQCIGSFVGCLDWSGKCSALMFLLLQFGECALIVCVVSQFNFHVLVFTASWFINIPSHNCVFCAFGIKCFGYVWFVVAVCGMTI
jgi:hypothetical protein